MKKSPKKIIQVFDLNLLAFLNCHSFPYEISANADYGYGLITPDDTFYDLSSQFNNDTPIGVKTFVDSLRRVRAQIMTAKEAARKGRAQK